jgi:hypothetical protein
MSRRIIGQSLSAGFLARTRASIDSRSTVSPATSMVVRLPQFLEIRDALRRKFVESGIETREVVRVGGDQQVQIASTLRRAVKHARLAVRVAI